MNTATEEWLTAARDDLEAVEEMLGNSRLTHLVAFHAQQCIEKSFKALLENHEADVPQIHNLITLHGRIDEHRSSEEAEVDVGMLDRLNQLYIDARYPGEQGLLPEGKPSAEETQRFFGFAGRVLAMIDQRVKEDEEAKEDE
jgi:HEPN domain-containing protein